jgi:hypothetical protein
MKKFLQTVGLDPLAAFAVIAIDFMLFAPDSTGVGWPISCIVALLLVLPCVLLQRFSFGDKWIVAIAKGIIVGILTAIPTPLPSIVTSVVGLAGLLSQIAGKQLPPSEK